MQRSNTQRIIAMLVAMVMVIGLVPMTAFARTAGKDGSAEMNETYASKESLMPVGPSFSTATLMEWTPESDPDAIYARASIPLAQRHGGFVVNPLVNPEAKLMLCSLANASHDSTSTQGTESFLSYAFNYWQYTNSFVYWSGSEEGLICCPTGEFTDAAHKNGVPVVATLGFPWGSGSGYVEEVKQFVRKEADGSFPVADKLIEVMDYYGFDGYFFNQESYGCSAEEGQLIDEMMRYMHEKRPDMLISWYDSMLPSGGVSYQNAVTSANSQFMQDSADGTRAIDEFMMNYNWYESQIATTKSTMRAVGRSHFDAFAGIDVQQNCMDTSFRDHLLVDEDGVSDFSLALYCPNSTMGFSTDPENFHQVERTFYTNGKADPRDTSVDLATNDWAGMSRFFADQTVILEAPFVTNFNSGHGRVYFVDGQVSRNAEWSYQSIQDIMPTWTWIIDSEGTKLSADYDFSTAWQGGNSLKFYGRLDAANDIMLYSTKVAVTDGTTLAATFKGDQGALSLVAYLGDENTQSYESCEKAVYAVTGGEDWTTAEADLSAHAGKTLYAIGLRIASEAPIEDYQLNLGGLSLLDGSDLSFEDTASVTLDEVLYTDPYTAEARICWEKADGAVAYEIYKVTDGERTLLMKTPSTAFYLPTLKREAHETEVTLEIVSVGADGQRGMGTEFTIDWAYTNEDGEAILIKDFENVALNAAITDVSFENSGEPASKALDGTAANNSKWCATNQGSGYMCIDVGREVTVRRWRVEHAEYGGEANNMNTVDFALEYKDAEGSWVEAMRIQNNHDPVTDVLLETPVTAQEWKLHVYDDGSSPWGGIRIYEWQMFETAEFPQTNPIPMHFATAVNGEGAADTLTLRNVPANTEVRIYQKTGEGYVQLATMSGLGTVTSELLDFGTADAGRIYYTTTAVGSAESAKLSAPFEAEDAAVSEKAEDVSFVTYSRPGSVSSSNLDGIYTTMTVSGLEAGDVVYVYENGADAFYTKSKTATDTEVSLDAVLVTRAGGQLSLQVKRLGQRVSEIYTVETPAFPEPTGTLRVFAKGPAGEPLTGVRYGIYNEAGERVASVNTTSDSGGTVEVPLGKYTLRCEGVPAGYGIPREPIVRHVTIEGWTYEVHATVGEYVEPAVTSVTLENVVVSAGENVQLNAVVEGEGNYSEELVWTLSGQSDADTAITADGLLTVGAGETGAGFFVTAASVQNPDVTASAKVILTKLSNVAVGAALWTYRGDNQGADTGPEKLVDGDLTTQWNDDVYRGDGGTDGVYYNGRGWGDGELVSFDLGSWQDIRGVRIHNAGGALNTDTVHLGYVGSSDEWLWYWESYTPTMEDRNPYLGYSTNYWNVAATISGNTEDVLTYTFDEAVHARYFMMIVEQANASTDYTARVNELEILVEDALARYVNEVTLHHTWLLTVHEYSTRGQEDLNALLTEALAALDAEGADLAEVAAEYIRKMDEVMTGAEEYENPLNYAHQAKKAAEEAQAAAEAAQAEAEAAASSAAQDKEAAEAAQRKAEEAQAAAEAAQTAAEAAQAAAEAHDLAAAQAAAEAAQSAAEAAAEAAKAAESQRLAQEAQYAAEVAQAAAEAAAATAAENQEAAEAARAAAEEARRRAEEAKAAADAVEHETAASAAQAAASAANAAEAQLAAQLAQAAAEAAAAVAQEARADAEEALRKAEEAAASAGADSETAREAAAAAQAAAEAAEAAEKAAEDAAAAAAVSKNAADASNKAAAEAAAQAAASAQAAAETYAEIVKIKAELVDYLNEAQKAAEEAKAAALASAKYYALITLAQVDTDGLTESQTEKVEAIVAAAVTAVEAAETAEEVEAVLAEALADIEVARAYRNSSDVFTDVKDTSWYHDSVDFVLNAGLMNGMSADTFGPNLNLTRAQLVTILYRVAGEPSVEGMSHPFTDVRWDYYSDALLWAYNNGIVNGVSETAFAPEESITRAQFATIMFRFDGAAAVAENHLLGFVDEHRVDGYAVDAMNWAVGRGLINGIDTEEGMTLQPKGFATRAQVATILERYLSN